MSSLIIICAWYLPIALLVLERTTFASVTLPPGLSNVISMIVSILRPLFLHTVRTLCVRGSFGMGSIFSTLISFSHADFFITICWSFSLGLGFPWGVSPSFHLPSFSFGRFSFQLWRAPLLSSPLLQIELNYRAATAVDCALFAHVCGVQKCINDGSH